VTTLHMGSLHPIEQLLTLLLAFGPFVILGGVIWWRRRTEELAEEPTDQPEEAGQPER
jgi:uncharacterized iron-regulated membrane protein